MDGGLQWTTTGMTTYSESIRNAKREFPREASQFVVAFDFDAFLMNPHRRPARPEISNESIPAKTLGRD
jgi:hypothetical protein